MQRERGHSAMANSAACYIKKHPIECMFFSEFHHKQGPKITYQYPDGFLKRDDSLYNCVINYIIPKPELQQKLITVHIENKKVIGCPVCIDNSKYPRNQYVFNFGLILDNKHRSSPCIPLIKQLSKYMTELELEQTFISNEETKKEIPEILQQMFTDLNATGECCTYVRNETAIYLKVFPPTSTQPIVHDHDVPVLCVDLKDYYLSDWDLTTQQVLPYIDGFRHVLKISVLADVDSQLTRTCIQDLAFYNIVKLTSIFQYCNMYAATHKLNSLMEDDKLQQTCLQYVTKSGAVEPTLHDIMTLYCGFSPGVTVENLTQRYQEQLTKVSERKLIQFGLIHGLIRHIQAFPLYVGDKIEQNQIYSWMDGQKSIGEICCNLAISPREFINKFDLDRDIAICYK